MKKISIEILMALIWLKATSLAYSNEQHTYYQNLIYKDFTDVPASFLIESSIQNDKKEDEYDCLSKCNTNLKCAYSHISITEAKTRCNLYDHRASICLVESKDKRTSIIFQKLKSNWETEMEPTNIEVVSTTDEKSTTISPTRNVHVSTTPEILSTATSSNSIKATSDSIQNTELWNHWKFNGNYNDSIGLAHLFGGQNHEFTFDRFNRSNSALRLNSGFLKAPPGVYFNSRGFTVMAWINLKAYVDFSRIIDFSNGRGVDHIFLATNTDINYLPYGGILNGTDNLNRVFSNLPLLLSIWNHLTFVYDGVRMLIYMNGVLTGSINSLSTPTNSIRSTCFIGESVFNVQYLNAFLDDLKIFGKALSANEIFYQMNQNS